MYIWTRLIWSTISAHELNQFFYSEITLYTIIKMNQPNQSISILLLFVRLTLLWLLCFIVNLSRSINEATSTIKIFWQSLCIEEPLQLICWPLKNECFYFDFISCVLRFAMISCFTKGILVMCLWNSRGGGKHHSLLSPGTEDFTRFHLHKNWMPHSSPNGGEGCGGFKWLVH